MTMTKALTKAEKDKRKKERREKRKQQKPASPTVRTITQPKPEPSSAVNLCDACAYEFGQCDGVPKFASDLDESLKGAEADRVIECVGFLPVEDIPPDQGRTGEEAAAPGPAAAEDKPQEPDPAAHDGDDQAQEPGPQGGEPELVHALEKEGATLEEKDEDLVIMTEDIQRGAIDRFATDETDYGACPSCNEPLKRTAYSRYVDAVRCVNGRCRAYRTIVKTVPTGAK